MTETEHCSTCCCVDVWPALPDGYEGVQVRYRKVFNRPMTTRPTRLGGAEVKMIVAETRQFVVWRTWSSKGVDLGESCLPTAEFNEQFERRDA